MKNLHDIVGAGRFTSGFGAQLQFHDRSRARELAQLQSAFAGSRVVFQGLQRKSEFDTRGGGRHPCEPADASEPVKAVTAERLGGVVTRSHSLSSSRRPAWSNGVTAGTNGSLRNPASGAGPDSSEAGASRIATGEGESG